MDLREPFFSRKYIGATELKMIGNESVPIQLAQCWFRGAGLFRCKNKTIFFKYNIRKQFYQTALENCCGWFEITKMLTAVKKLNSLRHLFILIFQHIFVPYCKRRCLCKIGFEI